MLTTALDTLVGAVVVAVIAAEAAKRNGGIGSLTTCYDHVTPVTQAQVGFWLTLVAMTTVAGYHVLRAPTVRGWIAQLPLAWTLRHAPTRPRRRHPTHRP